MTLVLDASALVELLLRSAVGVRVAGRLAAAGAEVHLLHLAALESVHAIRRLAVAGMVDSSRAGEAVRDLADLAAVRYEHEPLLGRVWELRHDLSAYDAVYVALAESLDVPLVTTDARLAGAPRHAATVEVVGADPL